MDREHLNIVQPPYWIDISNSRVQRWACSRCGEEVTSSAYGLPRYRYCPMCGVKMTKFLGKGHSDG